MGRIYKFGEFVLDSDTRELLREGNPIHLSPKAFQLVAELIREAPRALSKSALQELLWPDTFVVEANLQHLVGEIRSALGDDPRCPRFVRTVHGFGYAFKHRRFSMAERIRRCVTCRLSWGEGRVTLADGEHVVGRDPSADIVLESTTVSRRHARIRISAVDVTLEDLGSRNGSFVSGRRVEGTVKVSDGDTLMFGRVPVSVRVYSKLASTASRDG